MRDVLVGTLFAIGFFLLPYKGYDCRDRTAGVLGFVFALGVALFPTVPDGPVSGVVAFIGWVHVACAALFFMTLIFFSLFLFTKTDETRRPTRRKLQRNVVY